MESRDDFKELKDIQARIKLIPNGFAFDLEDLNEIWKND